MSHRWTRGASLLAATVLVTAALAGTAAARVDAGGAASKSVNVAFIYPKTGGLAAFGQEELDGFQAGLAYTSGKCGGYTINPTYIDDATDPATAINAFKNEVGQGVKIIAGTGSSGIALQLGPLAAQNNVLYISGAAAADAITGLNRNTFRAGRQTLQDVLDASNIFPPKSTGKKIVVFAEDTAFGAGNVAAVQPIFGGKGQTVSKILSPFGAADLTPYAQQLKNSGADAAFVAWANTTNAAAMWQSLQQQGVAKQLTIVTGLANRASYDALGPLVPGVTLLSHYVYQAPAQRGEHVPRQVDGEEPPHGARPLHTRRLRDRADDLPRGRQGRHGHREADLGARGLAVPRAQGQAADPPAGPRDAAADVPGAARARRRRPLSSSRS